MGAFFDKLLKKSPSGAKEAKDESKDIERSLRTDQAEQSVILKMLLLGAGESGKSTLFKQMVHIYGKGFSDEVRATYGNRIFKNLQEGIICLVKNSDLLEDACKIDPKLSFSKQYVNDLKEEGAGENLKLDDEFAKHVKALWADPGVRRTFTHRSKYQIPDSLPYFFERVEEIVKPGYIPTYHDVLLCRARTTGIVETDFVVNGKHFCIMDVGGQRSERKKWIHCFEQVTAVIFVAAISEFDQVLFEDLRTNRIQEAMTLFSEICNSRWFAKSSMILFLNKRDLFMEKVKKVDLSVCFPDYKDGLDYDRAAEFIKNKFLELNEHPKTMTVYTHITCATDPDNVVFTFNAVRNILLEDSLRGCGLS